MNSKACSPVSKSNRVRFIKKYDIPFIIDHYKESLDLDVRNYFKGHERLDVYECLDSGLLFYHPNTIVGDGKFYESIQHFSWYYVDEKWEFRQGLDFIETHDKVLEIGSGRGQFLKIMQSKTTFAEGLELNEAAVEKCRAGGLKVHLEKIDDFEKKVVSDEDRYDVVCSFQVYEHIENIGEVIRSSLNVLKPGGKLIISVPNNDCIYNDSLISVLNLPPHHQGLWYPQTFEKMAGVFRLKLVSIHYEPVSFINRFRLAAAHARLKTVSGERRSFQYLRSLNLIFKHAFLRKGRAMLACYEKI